MCVSIHVLVLFIISGISLVETHLSQLIIYAKVAGDLAVLRGYV